jgi:hypothetical protein
LLPTPQSLDATNAIQRPSGDIVAEAISIESVPIILVKRGSIVGTDRSSIS